MKYEIVGKIFSPHIIFDIDPKIEFNLDIIDDMFIVGMNKELIISEIVHIIKTSYITEGGNIEKLNLIELEDFIKTIVHKRLQP